MKRTLRLILLAAALSAVSLAADLTGTWAVKVELSVGTGTPTFKFKQDGDKLTGEYEGQLGTSKVEGKVTGDRVEFWFTVSEVKVKYTGTISGETMKGDADYGGQASGTWTAKRK